MGLRISIVDVSGEKQKGPEANATILTGYIDSLNGRHTDTFHSLIIQGRLIRLTKHRMLLTIATILIILWLFGLITSYTIGGFIHLLLVIAVIMVLVRLIRGENPIR